MDGRSDELHKRKHVYPKESGRESAYNIRYRPARRHQQRRCEKKTNRIEIKNE